MMHIDKSKMFISILIFIFFIFSSFSISDDSVNDIQLQKFQPKKFKEYINEDPTDNIINIIVIGKNNESMNALKGKLTNSAKLSDLVIDNAHRLELINGFALASDARGLIDLPKLNEVEQIWYIHPSIYQVYVNVISALEYNVKTIQEPSPVNISLAPPAALLPMEFLADEPINRATKAAAHSGKIIVFAAGNYGKKNINTLNPGCVASWVICVGAVEKDGKTLWEGSSVGIPGDNIYRPTIVLGLELLVL